MRLSQATALCLTRLSHGEGQILTPTESKPLNRSLSNLAHVIMSARRRAVPNLVQIRPRRASGQISETYRLYFTSLTLFDFFIMENTFFRQPTYMSYCARILARDGSKHCFHARMCLLGVKS